MAPQEDGQLFAEGACPGITLRCSLLPELVVDWRGLGGLILTLALEMSSICS